MEIGVLIREIRENKNIRSVDFYRDLLSRPAIIKFEKGLSDTTVNKFLIMLDRLNISLEEFEILLKREANRDFYYTNQYIHYFYLKDITALKDLADQAAEEFNKTDNTKYKHYNSLILLLIDYLNQNHVNKDSLDVLQSYLASCDNWGYYEITLFTNSLIFYSNEYIDLFYNRIKKKMVDYEQLKRHRNEIALLLFNILEKKILDKHILNIKFYLDELKQLKTSTLDNMYVQTMIKYFDILLILIINRKINDSQYELIQKIISFLDFLEMSLKSKQCQDLFDKVVALYDLELSK